jgi:hypothetical protein
MLDGDFSTSGMAAGGTPPSCPYCPAGQDWGCGAALTHIELLTGQPAMTVRGFMRRAGIPLRRPARRSPSLRA